MFKILENACKELECQRKLEKLYTSELQGLPEGKLVLQNKKGRDYFCKTYKGEQHYLGKENREVRLLKKRYFLEESLRRIAGNKKVLQSLQEKYRSITPEAIAASAPKAYRDLPQECFALKTAPQPRGWSTMAYKRNQKHPERLMHKTMKGDYVRSKSEAIIANMLFLREIEYRYEEVVTIGGVELAPDFRILLRSQNRYIYWEHMGMVGKFNYLETAMQRMKRYIEYGYEPWYDVIFTFEDIDGNINTQIIDKIITDFCI